MFAIKYFLFNNFSDLVLTRDAASLMEKNQKMCIFDIFSLNDEFVHPSFTHSLRGVSVFWTIAYFCAILDFTVFASYVVFLKKQKKNIFYIL